MNNTASMPVLNSEDLSDFFDFFTDDFNNLPETLSEQNAPVSRHSPVASNNAYTYVDENNTPCTSTSLCATRCCPPVPSNNFLAPVNENASSIPNSSSCALRACSYATTPVNNNFTNIPAVPASTFYPCAPVDNASVASSYSCARSILSPNHVAPNSCTAPFTSGSLVTIPQSTHAANTVADSSVFTTNSAAQPTIFTPAITSAPVIPIQKQQSDCPPTKKSRGKPANFAIPSSTLPKPIRPLAPKSLKRDAEAAGLSNDEVCNTVLPGSATEILHFTI